MSVSKYKIRIPTTDQQINIPVEIKWDFTERDEAIDVYQEEVVNTLIGDPVDFELTRFSHKPYLSANTQNYFATKIIHEFRFFDTGGTITNSAFWTPTYQNVGFSAKEIYEYIKPFTKSFFKLDFYDNPNKGSQKNYFTVILPVQQGSFETVTISAFLANVNIRIPKMGLDFVGDKEGFFFYWLKYRDYIDLDEFYMSAKFFDARQGVFRRMMNRPQSTLNGNYFNFNPNDYFYYKVKLDYPTKTYEIFSTVTNNRVGTEINPILWYELINP
jgi:hypothetical protein